MPATLESVRHKLTMAIQELDDLTRVAASPDTPPVQARAEPIRPSNFNDLTPEGGLFAESIKATSHANWVVGECAAVWMKRYSRGRTDADFAQVVGLETHQVYQRRRVWESFGDVYRNYPDLRWSHFAAAVGWDNWRECLQWAQDINATVAEMRAWRRAQRGEDLSAD